MALKLPFNLGSSKAPALAARAGAPAAAKAAGGSTSSTAAAPLPIIGALPVARQLQVLVSVLGVLAIITAFVILVDYRQVAHGTIYVSTAGQMRMLSQRIPKAMQAAQTGSAPGFRQLQEAREQFVAALTLLTQGGPASTGAEVPPTSDRVMPVLEELARHWEKVDRNVSLVLAQQKNQIGLGTVNNDRLLDLAEAIQTQRLAGNAPAREISQLGQITMLSQRLAKNASSLLTADTVAPELEKLLRRDLASFAELLSALQKGGDAVKGGAAREPDTLAKLAELERAFGEFQGALGGILANLSGLTGAKVAARAAVADSETLFAATQKLSEGYEREIAERGATFGLLALLALLLAAVVYLMVKVYNDAQRRARVDAERQSAELDRRNQATQDAILKLMNEMGSLADGDLTVKATVSEDVTGAIADSVNFTIEELRVLVGRITAAAAQVTAATEAAQKTSTQLLAAAEFQSREIKQTSSAMLNMAQAMNKMSAGASQSAGVARQSVAAAHKGTEAVQNSIIGMNEIREQIQQTSKRIKRLGESSQEIGEIVELISDITEQTNVLALNAAIQAASAGEAGRGFTVVAEEVQRLAERSGEATKQISAIVKTIQTDTSDAVSAMEKSTQGVVEGAKLSDAAGQALSEIGTVSQRLSQLIESITAAMKQQAEVATGVASNMQDILRITQQATEGTQRTANSIGQLAELAGELKGSVSRFKMN